MEATWHRRLAVRLALFLSVALIPVGLLAVMQTGDIVKQAEEREDTALVGLTRDAALAEREIIQRAFGMAIGLAPLALESSDGADCARQLRAFVEQQSVAVTAGVIAPDGDMWCASNGERYDFSAFPGWQAAVADPRATVDVNAEAPVSGRPVVVIMQPYYREQTFAGFIFLSIPHERLALRDSILPEAGFTVITLTGDGDVLTVSGEGVSDPQAVLPHSRRLTDLVSHGTWTFREVTASGETRAYAVSPIIDNTVYALGTWQPTVVGSGAPLAIPPQFFPLIMWLTSLGVALAAIHRLVIRHISRLRRQMRAFASDRRLPTDPEIGEVSVEIAEIRETFKATAETVLRDEAELEQLVHDKNVLLKEVHHRVKNNLQLISSIMNMQIRELKSPEARAAVQRLQDRVLGLATIHRSLYRTENLSQVQAAEMLSELTDQILAIGQGRDGTIAVERQFDEVTLYPDQAVPLSMLVAEATTNALKHAGTQDGEGWLRLTMSLEESGKVAVEIANSRTVDPTPEQTDGAVASTGLGTNLMKAFAMQLGGSLAQETGAQSYVVRVCFAPEAFQPET